MLLSPLKQRELLAFIVVMLKAAFVDDVIFSGVLTYTKTRNSIVLGGGLVLG